MGSKTLEKYVCCKYDFEYPLYKFMLECAQGKDVILVLIGPACSGKTFIRQMFQKHNGVLFNGHLPRIHEMLISDDGSTVPRTKEDRGCYFVQLEKVSRPKFEMAKLFDMDVSTIKYELVSSMTHSHISE